MSAPYDPQGQGGPGGQWSGPPAGAPGQQPYGSGPYGQPYGGAPYGQQGPGQPGYAYDPYGGYPAGFGAREPEPPRRPASMIAALIMAIVATLPFLFAGVLLLVVPLNAASVPPTLLSDPRIAQAGITAETLVSALRGAAGVMLVLALVYLLLAVLAFVGRNWARITFTVLSVGFVLLLVALLLGSGGAVDSVVILAVLIVLVAGAVVIMFRPAANRWYSQRR